MTLLIDICIFCLLAAGIVTAIIELGLTADIISWFDGGDNGAGAWASRVNFLLFCSIWTILVTGFLVVIPFLGRNLYNHRLLAFIILSLSTITMIFWLAGFAAFADLFDGGAPTGVVGATLAFAIIAWLIYLAILGLNIITALSVRTSERPGWTPMGRVTFERHRGGIVSNGK